MFLILIVHFHSEFLFIERRHNMRTPQKKNQKKSPGTAVDDVGLRDPLGDLVEERDVAVVRHPQDVGMQREVHEKGVRSRPGSGNAQTPRVDRRAPPAGVLSPAHCAAYGRHVLDNSNQLHADRMRQRRIVLFSVDPSVKLFVGAEGAEGANDLGGCVAEARFCLRDDRCCGVHDECSVGDVMVVVVRRRVEAPLQDREGRPETCPPKCYKVVARVRGGQEAGVVAVAGVWQEVHGLVVSAAHEPIMRKRVRSEKKNSMLLRVILDGKNQRNLIMKRNLYVQMG